MGVERLPVKDQDSSTTEAQIHWLMSRNISLSGNMRQRDLYRWEGREFFLGGGESVWVHRVHWKGLTLGFLSCNLSFSLSSLLADLNNLSHIIYLLLTHTHTHTSWGLDPAAGVGWSSWNLHREKPDSRPLCQTHEVTLSDWPCLPACLCSISASRFNLSVTEKLRKDAKVVAS